jgi:putative transposase
MLRRKSIRLPPTTYLGKQTYFITFCTNQRQPIFDDHSVGHRLVENLIATAANHDYLLHAYCLMPDHLHLLLEGREPSSGLVPFIHSFKQKTGFAHQARTSQKLWQPRYHDHVLRDACDVEPIAWYIWLNPVRKNLCQAPQDYPLSGSQTIDWKSRCAPVHTWLPPWKSKTMPP